MSLLIVKVTENVEEGAEDLDEGDLWRAEKDSIFYGPFNDYASAEVWINKNKQKGNNYEVRLLLDV